MQRCRRVSDSVSVTETGGRAAHTRRPKAVCVLRVHEWRLACGASVAGASEWRRPKQQAKASRHAPTAGCEPPASESVRPLRGPSGRTRLDDPALSRHAPSARLLLVLPIPKLPSACVSTEASGSGFRRAAATMPADWTIEGRSCRRRDRPCEHCAGDACAFGTKREGRQCESLTM